MPQDNEEFQSIFKGHKEEIKASSLAVTNVSVFLFNGDEGKLRGVARIVLNDALQLTGLRIYQGSNGLFVSYPNDPYYKGEEYRQLFYPISKELRDEIQAAILKQYYNDMSEAGNPVNDDAPVFEVDK